MLVVNVENLHVNYGKVHAVRGISLQIPRGEVYGFIGPNGAGKSSTIKVLATLLPGYRGRAQVNGIDVARDPQAVREHIGYMPDFFGVYEDLTAREYLHFFAAAYRIPRARRQQIVNDVLELTDLTHKIDDQVDSLSRGMKQRLALAHQHYVGLGRQRVFVFAQWQMYLRDNFAGCEIADQAQLRRHAELAVHRAAGLRRNTDRLPVFARHEDSFHRRRLAVLAVRTCSAGESEKVADRAVLREIALLYFRQSYG